jgi:hypothetical protein
MSTDRELLELAAKAAGLEWCQLSSQGAVLMSSKVWNPLGDDGDALRLSVKLRVCASVEHDAQASYWAGDDLMTFNEALGRDDYAAMRRAIVRAAADIGRVIT